jgi:acetolactate synthase I/II/III large subunit
MTTPRSGGRVLVDQLALHGADVAFTVPGESFLPVLDAFYDHRDIKLIVCRHEAGAANMAEAYGKLTGKPGLCFVTRGPGATHASTGVHTAFQDSTPMILFVGDVGSNFRHREAFQEVDFAAMFAPLAKWAVRIDRANRIPEYIARAYQVATSGRPGPVVIALPEDTLTATATVIDAQHWTPIEARPNGSDLDAIRTLLAGARRPLVILGGPGWSPDACTNIQRFASVNGLPIACAFRYQDLFDNRDANYVGDVGIGINPILAERVRTADVLMVMGARMGEMTTSGYSLIDVPSPRQKLIHIHPSADELGRVYQPELGVVSAMGPMAALLAAMDPLDGAGWKQGTQEARADYVAWTARREIPGKVQMWDVMDWLVRNLPADAILTNGAGNYATWVHRFYRYTGFRTQLAPTSGAMGYGVPAAIAAKIVHPKRTVVCFAGDGCFLMSSQELATAVQYNLAIIFIVVNNNMYGTIRMHQEKHYPGRVMGTDLVNPQFATLARAYGCAGEIVEETSQFEAAFERCAGSAKPSLIEIRIDPQAITPNSTLDSIRAGASVKR